ncbi:MAG: Gfo/Idh/MocA family protein [Chloroflexota bacterium]
MATTPVRVAILGAGQRSGYLYGPLIKALPREVTLVGIWSRTEESARQRGEELGAPWFTDLSKLVRDAAPQIGIVSVSSMANGQVALMAVEAGLHILAETPLAQRLAEADAIVAAANQRGRNIEVAEQFHRRPLEQLKLKLIASGLFGRVYASFNDFAGHGYHGVSVMRSFLGFDAVPVSVTGSVQKYDLAAHLSRISGRNESRVETQEHAIVRFNDDRLGIFHWTSVGYDSALRWWRSSRFLAERGMGITVGVGLDVEERLSLLAPGGEGPRFLTIERQWDRPDGGRLRTMVAYTGDPDLPTVRWENPFWPVRDGHALQWHDDEIGVASCLMSLVHAVRTGGEPTYGAAQGRLDQEIVVAMRQSAVEGGRPVNLPFDPAEQTV